MIRLNRSSCPFDVNETNFQNEFLLFKVMRMFQSKRKIKDIRARQSHFLINRPCTNNIEHECWIV
jgi:hypothetical protein